MIGGMKVAWWRKGIFAGLLLSLLLLPLPIWAQDPVHESGEDPRPSSRSISKVHSREAPRVLHEEMSQEDIAQGVIMKKFDRFDSRGWKEGVTLTVNLTESTVKTNLLTAGKVARSEKLSGQMKRAGAIAGVNGDFFDIGNTQAALGVEVEEGQVRKSGGNRLTASVTRDRLGQVGQLLLEGKVSTSKGMHPLHAINAHNLEKDELGLYTTDWGEASRSHLAGNTRGYTEVILKDNTVVEIRKGSVYDGGLKPGESILSGKGGASAFLRHLKRGDRVRVEYGTRPDAKNLLWAVGGGDMLVKDGKVVNQDDGPVHPRTAVGFSRDGKKMILAAVDGRSPASRGMTLWELAEWMKEQGAWTALNLDGGGSTTLVAREKGREGLKVVNTPSDGDERPVPNGIGIWNHAKTGKLKGFHLETSSSRVFMGLTRRFHSYPYDTAFAPISMEPNHIQWKAKPSALGKFKGSLFQGKHPGKGKVSAHAQGVKSQSDIHVLGRPVSLSIEPRLIGLEKGKTARFWVTGRDAEGYQTYVEPQDVHFEVDESLIGLTANKDGSVTVTPKQEKGSAVLKATVGRLTAQAGVTVGTEEKRVEDFEEEQAPWTFSKVPAEVTGSLAYVDVPERGGKALQLDYDFTTSTVTRAVYAQPPDGLLDLPGDVKKIGVHVQGDGGNGHWLRTRIKDAAGVFHTLDLARNVDWSGWKYVEAEVPAGVQYPIQLNQIYLVEPDGNKQDKGSILMDDVTIQVTESLNLPRVKPRKHPMVLQNQKISASSWKYAVLNDLHLVNSNQTGKNVNHLKQTLRELSQEDLDFVIFNGDLVDTDTKENYRFVKETIEDNLKIPYYVTPGNHETYGTGNLDNFAETFGQESLYHTFDHKGVRFILLNTSLGGLRESDPLQWSQIKRLLGKTRKDKDVKKVILLGHHPLRDPLPAKASQFSDGKEAQLLERWLTRFREESGKPVAVISAHAHVNHWDQLDGVPYAVIGPVGKQVYGAQDEGGFYSYAVFGVGQSGKGKQKWLSAEVRPILQDIRLKKKVYRVGKRAKVHLTGVQTEDWTFPLDYPATVSYNGSKGLLISEKEPHKRNRPVIAHLDPVTGTISFNQPGTVELTVKSGGMEKRFMLKGK
ncbi:hypothetical protein GXN76_12155 [Kroppenstedtia pulmonis]|uniref:Metallophosphoesterase n=1 Tax=Kroppenstedtia pulmonis TaxID=1380685 RepID=A0A7D3XQW7_9BACL|nr:phosphodiester glycosidase family protein [Kroppenstedtia pulmonis]QKG85147.1 hypothetical protein GXN76_12155 [Kroppenstedtia pulmonis]